MNKRHIAFCLYAVAFAQIAIIGAPPVKDNYIPFPSGLRSEFLFADTSSWITLMGPGTEGIEFRFDRGNAILTSPSAFQYTIDLPVSVRSNLSPSIIFSGTFTIVLKYIEQDENLLLIGQDTDLTFSFMSASSRVLTEGSLNPAVLIFKTQSIWTVEERTETGFSISTQTFVNGVLFDESSVLWKFAISTTLIPNKTVPFGMFTNIGRIIVAEPLDDESQPATVESSDIFYARGFGPISIRLLSFPEMELISTNVMDFHEDLPPSITTPASANPAVVTGTTSLLTVDATDTGGGELTFSWSVISGPNVNFETNNGTVFGKHRCRNFS